MKVSNKKYSVDENYSYDNFDFNFIRINYFTLRIKFIGDNDFLKNYKKFNNKELLSWKNYELD